MKLLRLHLFSACLVLRMHEALIFSLLIVTVTLRKALLLGFIFSLRLIDLISILFIVTIQIEISLIEILLVPRVPISAKIRVCRVIREHAC